MMKARRSVLQSLVLGVVGAPAVGRAQARAQSQLKFSRIVDLTLPIESNMAGIPGFKVYADNPSRVAIIAAMTDGQKELLRAEGLTIADLWRSTDGR